MKVIPAPRRSYRAVADLSPRQGPLSPALHAILEGRAPGEVFIDRPEPTNCLVKADYYGFSWFAGEDPAWLAHAIATQRPLWLISPPSRSWSPPVCTRRSEFLSFVGCELDEELLSCRHAELGTLELASIDQDLLSQCGWLEEMRLALGSSENFLANAFGSVLLLKGDIVAEAYGAFIGAGTCEIGVFTAEAYRSRGLARCVVAHVVAGCARRGLQPHWSCRIANPASAAVARAVGFHEVPGFELLVYA